MSSHKWFMHSDGDLWCTRFHLRYESKIRDLALRWENDGTPSWIVDEPPAEWVVKYMSGDTYMGLVGPGEEPWYKIREREEHE